MHVHWFADTLGIGCVHLYSETSSYFVGLGLHCIPNVPALSPYSQRDKHIRKVQCLLVTQPVLIWYASIYLILCLF